MNRGSPGFDLKQMRHSSGNKIMLISIHEWRDSIKGNARSMKEEGHYI